MADGVDAGEGGGADPSADIFRGEVAAEMARLEKVLADLAAAGRALQILGADVRLATTASMPNNRTLILTVRDQTGDAAEETVTYAWGGTTGDPFTRTFNADVVTLLPSVADLEFTSITRASVDTGDITTEPTERMRISISAGTAEMTGVTAEFRLLNARTSGGGGDDDDDD